MSHQQVVQGTDKPWVFTLPDQVTLSQNGSPPLLMSGQAAPLEIHVTFDANALFSSPFGLTISVPDVGEPTNSSDVTNGLRGPIQFVFDNQLGLPLAAGPGGTLRIAVRGASDVVDADPADQFHTRYAHFHQVDAQDFPSLVETHTGPDPATAASSPNTIELSGTIGAG